MLSILNFWKWIATNFESILENLNSPVKVQLNPVCTGKSSLIYRKVWNLQNCKIVGKVNFWEIPFVDNFVKKKTGSVWCVMKLPVNWVAMLERETVPSESTSTWWGGEETWVGDSGNEEKWEGKWPKIWHKETKYGDRKKMMWRKGEIADIIKQGGDLFLPQCNLRPPPHRPWYSQPFWVWKVWTITMS